MPSYSRTDRRRPDRVETLLSSRDVRSFAIGMVSLRADMPSAILYLEDAQGIDTAGQPPPQLFDPPAGIQTVRRLPLQRVIRQVFDGTWS